MPPKTIILIRHAEALHNATKDYQLPDPVISKEGRKQCQLLQIHLKEHLPIAQDAELIVTSPMRRTLETTQLSLSWLIEKGIPVLPNAMWQENSAKPCDTGTVVCDLEREFPTLDFSTVDPLYPQKTGAYAYNKAAVLQRGDDVRAWLMERPEKVIIVCSHSAFLRTSVANCRFANADFRVFDLVKRNGKARLREWKVTRDNGGGMGRSRKGAMGIEEDDFKPGETTT